MAAAQRPVGRPAGKTHNRKVAIKMPLALYETIVRIAAVDGLKPGPWIRRAAERAARRRSAADRT